MRFHRIALSAYSTTAVEAFSGRGGLYGQGRWHTPGRLIVYAAQHVSLAMAEILVHLQRSNSIAPYNWWEIEVPDAEVARPPSLPRGWEQDDTLTRRLGDAWLAAGSTAALLVPSAIIRSEFNCLLNPAHARFSSKWIISGTRPFAFDPRLTKP